MLAITIDYNNGKPLAEMTYKGKPFGKSPVTGVLPQKPKADDEKAVLTWTQKVKDSLDKMMKKRFAKTVYQNITVQVINIG